LSEAFAMYFLRLEKRWPDLDYVITF
jgi:hypothetical protein